MTATDLPDTGTDSQSADLTAADVAWDLEPLVEDKGAAGVDEHLDAAEAVAASIEAARGTIADLDAAGLAAVMQRVAELQEHLGRAGNYAGLRFTVDTTDPERGALMQRVEERGDRDQRRAAIFFELEWAALPDDRGRGAARGRPRSTSAAHYLRSARRYRPHLLTEPEEKILAEKDVTGLERVGAAVRASSRRRSRVDLDGDDGRSRAGAVAARRRPTAPAAPAAAAAVTEGLAPGSAHPRVRLQHAARRQGDRRPAARLRELDREPQPRQRGERRVGAGARRRGAGPLRHPAALVRAEGAAARASTGSPTTTAWRRVATADAEFGWSEATAPRARRVRIVLARARRRRAAASSTRAGSTPRCGRASGRARSARTRCRRTTRTCC